MLDRLITGARVFNGRQFLDNTNVGVSGAIVSYVGPDCPEAKVVTDECDRILSPSFIDSHTHADFHCVDPANDGHSAISQGVTTLVVGNCGISTTPPCPVNPILIPGDHDHNVEMEEHVQRLHRKLPLDIADLMGHGTLRLAVMGQAREATQVEVDRMAGILDDFLTQGGLGLSVGLNYPEALGYNQSELAALCRILAKHGRPLTCHIRDQGAGIYEAVQEVTSLGQQAGCGVLVSHLRPISNKFDHLTDQILALIESDDNFAMDLYPYVAGFTSLEWMFQYLFKKCPGHGQLLPTDEVDLRARDVCIGGLSDVHILSHQTAGIAGNTIAEIAAQRQGEASRVAQEIYLEDPNCLCIYDHQSTPEAVAEIITHPKCMLGSDGYLFSTGFDGTCHPRSFAAMTGFLVRYVRSGKVSLEDGLAKMTSRTADYFKLKDRGEIKVGKRANLVLFTLDELEERADFVDPTQSAAGMHEVLLAGETIWSQNRVNAQKRLGNRTCPH
jgi:N-acyl-D-aspartate/D-glutamate deacylase